MSENNNDYYAYGLDTYDLFDQTGQADWGYNAISNGGNTANIWRILTHEEWRHVLFERNTESGIRFAKANVNNVNGLILLPDDWLNSYFGLEETNICAASYSTNTISSAQWATLEQFGAIFLPAAGCRSGTNIDLVGTNGDYWASSHVDNDCAWIMAFHLWFVSTDDLYGFRCPGRSVRLIFPVQ